ncbi:MFS transporter, partial [uncultured Pseudoalteromonas sp.]|uniref:MFS transporter n=1 Tax=uncultured Pseudoalteromonas sp. TaxID=114053 RepID=UPI00261FB9A8
IAIPMGIGVMLDVSERIGLDMGLRYHYTLTDMIDGVEEGASDNFLVTTFTVLTAPIKSPELHNQKQSQVDAFLDMLKLTYQPLVLIFVVSAFLYVLIEQGVGTWLPTFNNQVLKLPVDVSIQLASLFAAALALGRLVAGQVLRFISWFKMLLTCLITMGLLILLVLPLTHDVDGSQVKNIFDVPFAAYMLPLVGFFMAPIYPLLNSVMLSSLEKHKHAAMTGLIVVFSALGGTTGSIITGFVFDKFSGQHAFYLTLLPIVLLLVSVSAFKKATLVLENGLTRQAIKE